MRIGVACLLTIGMAAGCQPTYDNPFVAPASVPLPTTATLLFVGNAGSTSPGAPRELLALNDTGGAPTRLTSCASQVPMCEIVEVAPAPDRIRVAVRYRLDHDRNGAVAPTEEDGIHVINLARGAEARTISTPAITGIDWGPREDILVFSAAGEGNIDDLFSSFANGAESGNRTSTPDVRERRFRFDPTGRALLYERSVAGQRSEIWLYRTLEVQGKITSGAELGSAGLPGTHYILGSDTDADFSPDLSSIVFRRLIGVGENGRGAWDILTINNDGTNLKTVASGAAYRSAPDWGVRGIAFVEIPVGSTTANLVIVDAFGLRRVVHTQGASFALDAPRWLP